MITGQVERVMGIEPTLVAWEATVLPLNYTRVGTLRILGHGGTSQQRLATPACGRMVCPVAAGRHCTIYRVTALISVVAISMKPPQTI